MRYKKADNLPIGWDYLKTRAERSMELGYPKQKWIEFCETLLREGYKLSLYEARYSYSKYITVKRKGSNKSFKVRFSNHKPIEEREKNNDCDFFVGITNLHIATTNDALIAVRHHFENERR